MPEENQLGNMLASLRKKKGGWTQDQTAAWLGVTRHTYSDWETGKRFPTLEKLRYIANKFELSQEDEDALFRAAAQVTPKIHNLPFPPNPFFIDRKLTDSKTYLDLLREFLQVNDSVALTQPVSISGLGGIGKTQLALEYAHRCFPNVYRAVFWVNAADKTTLQISYNELAQRLKLPELNEREPERTVQAVKWWLEEHTNWLLIMDNADDLQLARSFFPEVHRGHILLTTRSQIVGDITTRQIEVDKMKPEEGLLFLLWRSRVLKAEAMLDTVAADIRESALELVELLGRHPLALDQAGAYIEETEESFTNYISLYQEERRDLLNRPGTLEGKYSQHPETVAVTFKLCFQKARERHPLATDILHFCAFLQPDAIPEELFQHDNRFTFNKTGIKEGIIALRRYSLIKLNVKENIYSMHRTFSMHRLVQVVLIDAMHHDLQKRWGARVVYAVKAAFPPKVEFNTWWQCERLLPHALVCAMWTEDELAPKVEVAMLSQRAAIYLTERGQYTEAETLFARIRPIFEQHFGDEHRNTAFLLCNLANLYIKQGKYEQVEPLYKQALAIYENQLGAKHPNTYMVLYGLSNLYCRQGKYEQAEPIILQICADQESQLGVEHPDTIRSLSELADIYRRQGKNEQAESIMLRVCTFLESQLGAKHPNTASSLCVLAGIYQKQGKYEQAETLCHRALAIFENSLGAEHPLTAVSLHGLASILQDQGLHEQSEAFYQRALSIREQLLGATHPETQATKRGYAHLLHSIGRGAEAATLAVSNEPSV